MWSTLVLLMAVQGSTYALWIDQSHDDFQAGKEFSRIQTAGIRDCGGGELRTWELGAGWWSPSDGGLKILGQEWDLDHNGFKDVILCDNYDDVKVYWNNGNGFDPAPVDLSVAPYQAPQAIHLVDLNSDGFTDILVGTGCYSQASFIFYGTSNRSVWRKDSVKTQFNTYGAQDVVPIDLNHDGYLDLVITGSDELWVLYGPNLSYRAPDRIIQVPGAQYICRTQFADLNNDEFLDIVTGAEGPVSIILGPDFTQVQHLEAGDAWDIGIADLNQDGWLDLAVDGSYGGNHVFWGSRDGFAQDRSLTLPGDCEGDCAVADFNNDGVLDLAMGEISGFHMGESYVFYGPRYASNVETLPGGSVTAADFNNDGYIDLLMHWFVPQPLLFWNQRGGFDPNRYTSFPCIGDDGLVDELGAVWDRSNQERFLSRVIDILPGDHEAPKNDNADCCFRVGVYGNLPEGMRLSVQVRSSLCGRRWTRWHDPSEDVPEGAIAGGDIATFGRFFQYRLVAEMDYHRTSLFRIDSVKAFVGTDDTRPLPRSDVSERPVQEEFRVVGNAVALNVTGRARLTVSDITGRTLSERNLGAGSYQIPVASAQGVYVVRFESAGRTVTKKAVVSR
jgi:hypothetical protein